MRKICSWVCLSNTDRYRLLEEVPQEDRQINPQAAAKFQERGRLRYLAIRLVRDDGQARWAADEQA